jgi:RNA polymerase sigma factor (sigma-70 family)
MGVRRVRRVHRCSHGLAPRRRARYKERMEAGVVPRLGRTRVPTFSSPVLLRVASDARLVALIREGRSAAFEAAYNRHHRPILSFCRQMLGDPDEAEDAVQHTFAAAYTELMASQAAIHLRPWLFAIARNRCYSVLRARREQPVAEVEEVPSEGLAAQVQAREDLRELVQDLQSLPDEQRAALVLAELDALSHAEISAALGVPREKVKSLVFQARESLIASRAARETECIEIRKQLAAGRGAALRRANLRRHLRQCDGCREFRAQVAQQRRQFALLLPVVPTIALKQAVLGGAVGGGMIGGGLLAPTALKSAIAKGVMGAMLAGAGTAGTVVVAASDLHVGGLDRNVRPALRMRPHAGGARIHAARHASIKHASMSAGLLADATHVRHAAEAKVVWHPARRSRSNATSHRRIHWKLGVHHPRAIIVASTPPPPVTTPTPTPHPAAPAATTPSYTVARPTGLGTGSAALGGNNGRAPGSSTGPGSQGGGATRGSSSSNAGGPVSAGSDPGGLSGASSTPAGNSGVGSRGTGVGSDGNSGTTPSGTDGSGSSSTSPNGTNGTSGSTDSGSSSGGGSTSSGSGDSSSPAGGSSSGGDGSSSGGSSSGGGGRTTGS